MYCAIIWLSGKVNYNALTKTHIVQDDLEKILRQYKITTSTYSKKFKQTYNEDDNMKYYYIEFSLYYAPLKQDLQFGSGFGYLTKAVVIFSMIYFTSYKDSINNRFLLFLVSYFIFNCGINFMLLQRLSNYFEISFLALTAYNIKFSKKFIVKDFYYLFSICLIAYFLMLFVLFYFSPDAKDWIPYKSLFIYKF